MNDRLVNMYRNIFQLKNWDSCIWVEESKYNFLAEINIRNGKYRILVDYNIKRGQSLCVEVYLIYPEIKMDDYIEIHTFGLKYHSRLKQEVPKLCLKHRHWEWNSSIPLIESYIPWASEWTEFYELWELTGVWHGGGVHVESKESEEN